VGAGSQPKREFALIDDDGRTLWMSPTRGEPLNLAYLPTGSQIIVALRPEALVSHPESEKLIAAIGPSGRRGLELLDELLLTPRGVKQLTLGLRASSDGRWRVSFAARLSGGASAEEHLRNRLPTAIEKDHAGTPYRLAESWAYYAPATDHELLVITPEESIAEIMDLEGDPPPLRRDVERVLTHTDADRHVTIILAPNIFNGDGKALFQGPWANLHPALSWFFGDELGAVALSFHWDDNFFIEFLAVPTLDTSPERTSRILADRLTQMQEPLEDYVVGLNAQPYGRRVVARFPAMVRKLAAYARIGFDSDHAILRCYLPAIAGHNLLMGAELVLAESLRANGESQAAGSSANMVPKATTPSNSNQVLSVQERLRRISSLAIPRDTLEAALNQLSQDIGVEIVIAGPDLRAEGITKNQSFGIDLANRPAEEILIEILRLANPDRSATAPHDNRQKLVYVTRDAEPNAPGQIVVTTRSAATARGEQLPRVFREKSP
jgi:hypothetical protein